MKRSKSLKKLQNATKEACRRLEQQQRSKEKEEKTPKEKLIEKRRAETGETICQKCGGVLWPCGKCGDCGPWNNKS
jgi:hypothetical protein